MAPDTSKIADRAGNARRAHIRRPLNGKPDDVPDLLRIDAGKDRNKRHADSILARTARSPVFSLPASGGGAVFHTASSTPSNCINTNAEVPHCQMLAKRLRPPPGRRPLLFNCTYFEKPPCFATPRSPAVSSRSVCSPPESCKVSFLTSVRSSIQRFTVSKDGSLPRPAPRKTEGTVHIAPRCDLQQGIAGGVFCAHTDRSPPGNLDFHFSPTVGRSLALIGKLYAYFSRLHWKVLELGRFLPFQIYCPSLLFLLCRNAF